MDDLLKFKELLKEREDLFRVLLQNLVSGVALVDSTGRFTIVNRSFLRMFDIADDTDIMNVNNRDWSQYEVYEETGQLIEVDEHPVRKAMMTAMPVRNKMVGVKCPSRKNIQWMLITAEPILNEENKVHQLICTYYDITERKLATEALRSSEEQLRFALETSHTGAWDLNLIDHTANRSLEHDRIFGYQEMLPAWTYEMFLEHVIPEDRCMVQERFRNAIESNTNWNFECRIKTVKNEIRWIWAAGRQYSDKSETPQRMAGIVQDITDRKEREERIIQNQKAFSELVELAPFGIYTVDSQFRVAQMNKGSQEGAFKNIRPIIGRDFSETMRILWPEEVAEEIIAVFRHTLSTGEPYYSPRFTNRRADTKNIESYEWELYRMTLPDGQFGVICYYYDSTVLRDIEDALRRSQEQLNIALENGNIGIWEWNLKTDEVIWDKRMERMFGLEPGTFGKTVEAFENLVNEEDIYHIHKAVDEAVTQDVPFDSIFRLRSGKEKTKYFKSKALVMKDKDGNPSRITGVCMDVTGLKEGTEHLSLKLNEELLRSNKELERFAYVASHDLQEPLRMVSSYTQLLQQRYSHKLDKDAQDFMNFAVDGAKRMYDQINGLLEYSRVNSKTRYFMKVDMNLAADKARIALENSLREKNLQLTVEDLPEIVADEVQMIQLFQNLLSNSVKFSFPGKTIHIGSKVEGEMVVFSIRDEGIGIEEKYHDKIFEMFQRLNPKDEYEGTGMGLAICKRIVERHGGRIWVSSSPGGGSTFFFSLHKNKQLI